MEGSQAQSYNESIVVLHTTITTSKQRHFYTGAGVFISKNMVLTTASNIIKNGKEVDTLKMSLMNKENNQIQCSPEKIFYPQEYKAHQYAKYNYSLIKLTDKAPFFNDRKQLKIAINFNDFNSELQVMGEPINPKQVEDDYDSSVSERQEEQRNLQDNNRTRQNFFQYQLCQRAALPGCPIVTGDDRDRIVSFHGAPLFSSYLFVAKTFNFKSILNLQSWREEVNGAKFKLYDYQTHKDIDLQSGLLKQAKDSYCELYHKNKQLQKDNSQMKSIVNLYQQYIANPNIKMRKATIKERYYFRMAKRLSSLKKRQVQSITHLNLIITIQDLPGKFYNEYDGMYLYGGDEDGGDPLTFGKVGKQLSRFSNMVSLRLFINHPLLDWAEFDYLAQELNKLKLYALEINIHKRWRLKHHEPNWTMNLSYQKKIILKINHVEDIEELDSDHEDSIL